MSNAEGLSINVKKRQGLKKRFFFLITFFSLIHKNSYFLEMGKLL